MKKIVSKILILLLIFTSLNSVSVFASQKYNCWSYEFGSWRYFDDRGLYTIDKWIYSNGNWYYIDYLGRMATGWLCIWEYNGLTISGGTQGNWYYFDSSGALVAS